MTQIDLQPDLDHVEDLSDPALAGLARGGDQAAVEQLVLRHGLAMTRFETTVGLAVTPRPAERIRRLVDVPQLPLRAAWLTERATGSVHDADDTFMLARFTELTAAWRLALWHAEVEGDSPVVIGRLLGLTAAEAALTVRTARIQLLWSVVETTPSGEDQDCIDTAVLLCNAGADSRTILGLAAAHGRSCDDCMLLVKRALLFASSLRDSLLRPLAGDLATSYSAARPPAFRPGPRGDLGAAIALRSRPLLVTAGMGVAAAAAAAALAIGPGVVPAYVGPRQELSASVERGTLLLPASGDAPPATPITTIAAPRFAPDDLSVTLPGTVRDEGSAAGGDAGTDDEASIVDEPSGSTDPETPGQPGEPVQPGTGGETPDTPDTGKPGGAVIPPVHVEAGPVTVDTGGDEPLVTVDGPVPVEVPPLPDLGLGSVTETTSGVVTGLLG